MKEERRRKLRKEGSEERRIRGGERGERGRREGGREGGRERTRRRKGVQKA